MPLQGCASVEVVGAGALGGAVYGTKASEFKTKHTTWSLGPPKPISKEFLSLAWSTKFLANFENHHTLLVFEIKKVWEKYEKYNCKMWTAIVERQQKESEFKSI